MPQPGDILVYKNFPFEDGSQKDKLFVVLNHCDLERPCIALKTTSKDKRYQDCIKGCNKSHKCFYAPNDWQTCFTLHTYIQLPQIFEFATVELLRGKLAGTIEFLKDTLTSDCLGQLRSCLAGYKDDITTSHWNLIYKGKP